MSRRRSPNNIYTFVSGHSDGKNVFKVHSNFSEIPRKDLYDTNISVSAGSYGFHFENRSELVPMTVCSYVCIKYFLNISIFDKINYN